MRPSRALATLTLVPAAALAASSAPATVGGPMHVAAAAAQQSAPDGRTLTPAGITYPAAGGFPSDAVLAASGTVITTDTGEGPNLVEAFAAADPTAHTTTLPTATISFNQAFWASSGSETLSPDGATVYVGGGTTGTVRALTATSPPVETAVYTVGGYVGGVAVTPDGARLLITQTIDRSQPFDKGHQLLEYTMATGAVRAVTVGAHPQALAVGSPPGAPPVVAVANRDDGTVTILDLATLRPIATVGTGRQPAALRFTADARTLLVVDSLDDTLVDIAAPAWTVASRLTLAPPSGVGAGPSALAVDGRGTTAYVALSPDNALAVVQRSSTRNATWQVAGRIPTGRYPTAVVVDPAHSQLLVTVGKSTGVAAGAMTSLGSLEAIPLPTRTQLAAYSAEVAADNTVGGGACTSAALRTISHVVYIVRENKTYDEEFGDEPGGYPGFVMYPRAVTPNSHALAEHYALLENFHSDEEVSDTGHQAAMGSVANDWVQRFVQQSYGLDGAPRPGAELGNDSNVLWSPSAYLMDNALAHGVSFRDYGEFYRHDQATDAPLSTALAAHIDQNFPGFGFNLGVPDTQRASYWISHFQADVAANTFPQLEVIYLPEDHTHEGEGGHIPQQEVADSDLATGQIVEALSKSPYWAGTAVFLTEDDPQSGTDHIDANRTIGLVIGPHVNPGLRTAAHLDQTGMLRTMEEILGLPALTEHDATARPFDALFTTVADTSPYTAITPPSPSLPAGVTPALLAARADAALGPNPDLGNIRPPTIFDLEWFATHGGSFTPPVPPPTAQLTDAATLPVTTCTAAQGGSTTVAGRLAAAAPVSPMPCLLIALLSAPLAGALFSRSRRGRATGVT